MDAKSDIFDVMHDMDRQAEDSHSGTDPMDQENGMDAEVSSAAPVDADVDAAAGARITSRTNHSEDRSVSDGFSSNSDIPTNPDQATAEVDDDQGPAARDEDDTDADTDTLEAPEGSSEQEITTERVVEAILFATDAPLPLSKIVSILGVGSARDMRNHIKALNQKYEKTGASFRIEQIASGYQMLTLPMYNTWIRRLKQTNKDNKLSQAAMETLAVVAYKQPVVRADIEAIRGVSAGEMLNRLREVGLIKIVGRAEDVGRPMLYGTTKRFLEVFGLSGLEDLPAVEEMQAGE
jgi:segregation and condensation protein B